MAMIGNLLHPMTPVGDPTGVGHAIHGSDAWSDHPSDDRHRPHPHARRAHGDRLSRYAGPFASAMARFGWAAALVGVYRRAHPRHAGWHRRKADSPTPGAQAPSAEQAAALRDLVAEETMNFALVALFNIVFAGVTFILYGLAVASSNVYPRWLGWPVVVAGIGSIAVGVVQAQVGESTGISRVASIVFPTIITVWVAALGVLLLLVEGASRLDSGSIEAGSVPHAQRVTTS